jgi:hypothetical protein
MAPLTFRASFVILMHIHKTLTVWSTSDFWTVRFGQPFWHQLMRKDEDRGKLEL